MKSRAAELFLEEYVKDGEVGIAASDINPFRQHPEEMSDLEESAM